MGVMPARPLHPPPPKNSSVIRQTNRLGPTISLLLQASTHSQCKFDTEQDLTTEHFSANERRGKCLVCLMLATALHELVPCCCTFNVSCQVSQRCHPVTRVARSAISPFYSSTASVFHDISLPRHQSSTTPVVFLLWSPHFGLDSASFLTDCTVTRA